MIWLMSSLAVAAPIVLQADAVRTVSGEVIEGGTVVVEDGRITAVGTDVVVPEEAQVFRGAVLTPGLIDTWSTAGLTGPYNRGWDQDHSEWNAPVRPDLRALDGYHPHDALVAWIRGYGVTVLNAGPAPGAPVGGRTLVTRTHADDVDRIAIAPDAFVVFTLGDVPKARFADQGTASRMGNAAMIRQTLAAAREYRTRRGLPMADRPPIDLGAEALVELLDGKRRGLIHAHRADDILSALRIAQEFEIDVVLAGAAEAYLVRERLAAADVPVLVGPVMSRSWRPGEQRHSSFENAGLLADAGVKVAFMSGYEGYVPKVRVVLWEAAIAGANGLGAERTLRALTLNAAEILGIESQTGSIEVGKAADLVLYDGDPFEYSSHACVVLSEGVVVSEQCR